MGARPAEKVREGDVALIRARVRAVCSDGVTVRIKRTGHSGFTQETVPYETVAGVDRSGAHEGAVPGASWMRGPE